MVKGVARRVIMVQSPDPKLFEQAIFLVRENALHNCPPNQALREAEQAATRFLHQHPSKKRWLNLPVFWSFLTGGFTASLIWAGVLYCF